MLRPGCTAVILPPRAMSFQRVAGVPLIQRTALSALRSGFDSVVALAPGDGRQVRALFARDPRTAVIPVVGGAFDAAISTERVAFIPSDYLVDRAALEQACATANGDRAVALGTDGDSAIVVAPHAALVSLDGTDPIHAAVAANAQHIPLSAGLCIPVPDAQAADAAERALVRQLATTTAATDGPIARLDRAISTRISRHIVRTPLRPNHITIIGTTVGCLAAWSLAQGTYWSGVVGTLLFWFAVIIDGCDGEVARLKFQESFFGYVFDVTTDNLVHVAIFIGLGVGLYRAAPDGNLIWLVGLLVGGFACSTAATLLTLARKPTVTDAPARSRRGKLRQRLLHGFEALMNRDFAYILLALALIGRLDWFLWGAAFGTYAYAGALVMVYRWRDAD